MDVSAEPLMASQGSKVKGAMSAGLDSEATQVSEDLQVFVSPLGALIQTPPVGHLSQHRGG